MEDIVSGDDGLDDDVVPNDFSEAAVKGDVRSAGIFQTQGEFVGLGIIVVAVAGRRSWEGDDWGLRGNWDVSWGRDLRRESGRGVLRGSDYWNHWSRWGHFWWSDYARSIESWNFNAGSIDGWDAD